MYGLIVRICFNCVVGILPSMGNSCCGPCHSNPCEIDDCGCVDFYATNVADVGQEEVCTCGHKRSDHRDLEAQEVDDEHMKRATYKLYGLDDISNAQFDEELQQERNERELRRQEQQREAERDAAENAKQPTHYVDATGQVVRLRRGIH
eukprot:gb/GECG01011785.1/.p1 GENE.gb/GECG01011785.1/~~gb/GECG01011785.1/.p1  ORF type:complete len:149 (+),score=16.76 gb/GECG01011785.1/:1-447(+)